MSATFVLSSVPVLIFHGKSLKHMRGLALVIKHICFYLFGLMWNVKPISRKHDWRAGWGCK